MNLKILFFGDVVGKIGRRALTKIIPEIKKEHNPDFIIANGENAAHGIGISKKIFEELKLLGVDFLTLGDHAFDKEEISEVLGREKSLIIRPHNFPPGLPGAGESVVEVGSKKILIVNLVGRVFMKMNYDCPFRAIDAILEKYKSTKLSAIIVDFHAEATSEKVAFGWHVDGRVSAVVGTHTHIGTCDNWILPKGTGYITDVGMVGPKRSIIGRKIETTLPMFLYQKNMAYEPVEEGSCIVNAILLEIDSNTARAKNIQRLDKIITI